MFLIVCFNNTDIVLFSFLYFEYFDKFFVKCFEILGYFFMSNASKRFDEFLSNASKYLDDFFVKYFDEFFVKYLEILGRLFFFKFFEIL